MSEKTILKTGDQVQRRRPASNGSDRGSSVVGLAVFTPVMATLLFFVIAAGRVGTVESRLTTAASGAARAATHYQSIPAAQAAAIRTAVASLGQSEVSCQDGPKVYFQELDLKPGGRVSVRISCSVRLSDLALPGFPGSLEVSAASASVVDRYRGESASP